MNDNKPMSEHEQYQAETETIERATLSGQPVHVDPDTAERLGVFEETALDATEADQSRFDVDPETGVVLDDAHGEAGQ